MGKLDILYLIISLEIKFVCKFYVPFIPVSCNNWPFLNCRILSVMAWNVQKSLMPRPVAYFLIKPWVGGSVVPALPVRCHVSRERLPQRPQLLQPKYGSRKEARGKGFVDLRKIFLIQRSPCYLLYMKSSTWLGKAKAWVFYYRNIVYEHEMKIRWTKRDYLPLVT